MKQLTNSHTAVAQTIEAIIAKGGQHLYEGYIKQKLPQHAQEQTHHIIDTNFNAGYAATRTGGALAVDDVPIGLLRETIITGKVPKDRAKVSDNGNREDGLGGNLSFRQKEQTIENRSGVMTQRSGLKRFVPKLRQKISINCKSLMNPQQYKIPQQQISVRVDKKQKQQKQQCLLHEQHQRQQQKISKLKKLQKQIQQLEILGVPYAFDDEGNLHSPNIQQFKYERERNEKLKKKDRIMRLKYDTIDIGCIQRYVKDVRNVVGRKRGYFSSEFYKKLRMTNEEYNNQNGRQNSNIPFLNLTEGIRIVQRQRNVIAQKLRKPIPTLSQYKQKTQSNLFKSFIPDYQSLSMQTMSIDRPFTTGQFNRTKRTAETSISNRMNNSILWRPKTTSKGCRMSVNNEELARNVMRIDQ